MTTEMKTLYASLISVGIVSIAGAHEYISDKLRELDRDGTLSRVYDKEVEKNVSKDLKTLKKYYKGKLDIDPKSIYEKYEEISLERFYLMCIIQLMKYNGFE